MPMDIRGYHFSMKETLRFSFFCSRRRLMRTLFCATLSVLFSASVFANVPDPVKSRFVVGDAVWREIPIRDDLQGQYDKCWQTAINAILESNFAVATMDKESGY